MLPALVSCKKDNSGPDLATVSTQNLVAYFESVRVYSTISKEGKSAVSAAGIAWATHAEPTVFDHKLPANGFGVGNFTCLVTGLTEGTVYYIRSYAVNGSGTSYSEEKQVSTRVRSGPVAATHVAAHISYHSFTAQGEITNAGSSPVTKRGFFYGNAPNPRPGNGTESVSSDTSRLFSKTITGLAAGQV